MHFLFHPPFSLHPPQSQPFLQHSFRTEAGSPSSFSLLVTTRRLCCCQIPMLSRLPGTVSNQRRRHDRQITRTAYSVQDRRQNARVLQASEQRRAQLCPLTSQDVARRLHHARTEPTTLFDDTTSAVRTHRGRYSAPPSTVAQAKSRKRQSSVVRAQALASAGPQATEVAEGLSAAPTQPPKDYEEWLSAGCPTASWSTLLAADLYGKEEAGRAFLERKYRLREGLCQQEGTSLGNNSRGLRPGVASTDNRSTHATSPRSPGRAAVHFEETNKQTAEGILRIGSAPRS